MTSSIIWILTAFAIYLLFMVVIGFMCAKQNENAEDYFLGGRKLSGAVAALSAQASDMSGWLLMGLPGSIYAMGTGCWTFSGNGLQLAADFQASAPVYNTCEQCADTANVF